MASEARSRLHCAMALPAADGSIRQFVSSMPGRPLIAEEDRWMRREEFLVRLQVVQDTKSTEMDQNRVG